MIDARDLRIDNVMNFENKFVPEGYTLGFITSIDTLIIKGISVYNKEAVLQNYTHQIEPIQLTEEILLKCGFIKEEKHSDVTNYMDSFGICIAELNGKFYFDEISKEVKYLHKLQNLHYELYDRELKIEL